MRLLLMLYDDVLAYLQCVPAVEDEPHAHHVNQRTLLFRQTGFQGLAPLTAASGGAH
jgi:hypothetical protein